MVTQDRKRYFYAIGFIGARVPVRVRDQRVFRKNCQQLQEAVYYRFPIDRVSALYYVKNTQEKISSIYGDPEIHVTRMTGNVIDRKLSLSALYKQIEIWKSGLYDLKWEDENYLITFVITINPDGNSDARVQIAQK